ncbi:MAG: glycosyltransferase [Prevotella sp.]|jgi:glycosyltransferase involved in cell wall biosynthesis|nr:glycosyltransferase [Prevotella sp.]MCI1281501.1 glycosyltransferase [Prevotella sp.]
MRILQYIPNIDKSSGGTTSYIQLLASKLGKLVDLHIVTHLSSNVVEIKNCTIHYIPTIAHFIAMKREWLKILMEIQPDVIHVNCCWMPGCAYVQKWAQSLGYKVVLTPHGMLEPWIIKRHYWNKKIPALLLYQKKTVAKADIINATAETEKANILKLGYNDKVVVIPNGIDVDNIVMKNKWTKQKKILFLSRIHEKKGLEILIESVERLKNQMKDYKIIVAGEGSRSYIQLLKEYTKKCLVDSMFDFVGGVYGIQKWKLYRCADVFILPTYSENFGIVVAEALASGTPVITTKGAPWQDLETCHCGFWTEIGIDGTVDALRKFLTLSASDLEVMGKNGRKLIEDKYSSKIMAEKMFELYKSL